MRAVRIPLESSLAPAEALLLLRGDTRPFALVGDWAGGGALLGSAPVRALGAGEDPFAALAAVPLGIEAGDAVIGGGWFGVLGYRLGERVERLPPGPPAPVETPAHRLAFYDHLVRFDGERWWFEALREDHPRLDLWRARLGGPAPTPGPFATGEFRAVGSGEAGHVSAVAECVSRIAAGELFQANLTLRLEAAFAGDPLDAFARTLPLARPRFGACLDGVISLSPERFLRRTGRRVETEPIKGTASSPAPLLESAKDLAEHVMIVDLMRNDLGRVCEYGSIEAGAPRLEAHANVWHLVSTVAGELRPDASDADLLRATFPPGSVTGAPKVQAMKVIASLEATRREAYTGAIGYASPIAGLELSVAIRTFETAGDRIWLGAGGGIVADSDPHAELREALDKAAGPVAAVLGRIGRSSSDTSGPAGSIPRALDHGPRPDPRAGLLETILVADGAPQRVGAHLERLAASARELYDLELPTGLAARIAAAARGTGRPRLRLRLRLVLLPDGTVTLDLAPLGAPPEHLRLQPFVLPGGLGRHKWADRTLVQALAAAAPRATPLLVDRDGCVLEATWANVFAVEGDAAVTPPADGRILPGIHRTRIAAREEPIDLARLEAADEVFLTSALRKAGGYRPSSRGYSRA